jgi:transcriptional regulator with XRE-family HTH domain
MVDLTFIGQQIAERRRNLKLSQVALARKALISRATLEALENGLAVLGLELKLQANSHRPTLDELLSEDRDDQSLDRRR